MQIYFEIKMCMQIFKLRVEHETLDESWLVFRRYTDFVRLHSKVTCMKHYESLKIMLFV